MGLFPKWGRQVFRLFFYLRQLIFSVHCGSYLIKVVEVYCMTSKGKSMMYQHPDLKGKCFGVKRQHVFLILLSF